MSVVTHCVSAVRPFVCLMQEVIAIREAYKKGDHTLLLLLCAGVAGVLSFALGVSVLPKSLYSEHCLDFLLFDSLQSSSVTLRKTWSAKPVGTSRGSLSLCCR